MIIFHYHFPHKFGLTQIQAKDLLAENAEKTSFAVVAGHQNAGKGTRGRKWLSGSGNLFLTVVLKLKSISTPLTLVPLRYPSRYSYLKYHQLMPPIGKFHYISFDYFKLRHTFK